MSNNELKVTLVGNGITIVFNDYSSGTPTWVLRNTSRLLSKLGTRQSIIPKQSAHGVDDGLSQDDARTLLFDGELHAASQSDRRDKERSLRQCVGLPVNQSYVDSDGYIRVTFVDEDSEEYQCYAKIVNYPEFDIIDNVDPTMRTFDFAMFAKDPFLYSTTLTEESGTESSLSTTFTIQDGDLPSFKDGALPTVQDDIIAELTVTNDGSAGTPPVITIYGPTASPVVENTTTGKVMDLSYGGGLTLLTDERVEIDVLAGTITKVDSSDVETDASAYLTLDSDWIYIDPGDNVFTLFDSTPGTLAAELEIQFRKTFK